jgi:RNA polymerase sigma factor (sigma-70 family)
MSGGGSNGGQPFAAERERAALELIAVSGAALKRTARRYSLCAHDSEDAYQRALEILLAKAPTTESQHLIRWMHTVTKHEALAVRRHRERMLSAVPHSDQSDATDAVDLLPALGAGPAERAMSREHIARSSEALHTLKPQELRALVLKAEGYSYAEICELTGWTFTNAQNASRIRAVVVYP